MMKIKHFLMLSVAAMLLTSSTSKAQTSISGTFNPQNAVDSIAYTIGTNIGVNLRFNLSKDSLQFPLIAVLYGFRDALEGKEHSIITEAQKQDIMQRFQKDLQDKIDRQTAEKAKQAKVEGDKWLKENAAKEGVLTTPSGLQYKVIQQGTGLKPQPTDNVTVHYEGKLIDGTIFDSSYERKTPASFPLNKVISGWQEGLQLMNEGSIYELYIPSNIGYGDQGYPPNIPGGSVLIFKVELIKTEAAQ